MTNSTAGPPGDLIVAPAAAPRVGDASAGGGERRGSPAWLRRIDARLVAPGSARTFLLVRSLVAASIGVRLVLRRWWSAAHRPAALYQPVAVIGWLHRQPSAATLLAVEALGVVGVGAVLVRRASRLGYVVAWLAYLFLAAVWGSSGKVMHNELLLLGAGFPLLFAPTPRPDELELLGDPWGWPPRAALAVIGGAYFASGFQKVRYSGGGWVVSNNLSWVLRQGMSPFGHHLNTVLARQHVALHTVAGATLAVELGAPVMLAVRRTRPVFAALVLLLHGGVWALLGLDYAGWVLAVAAVAIPMAFPSSARPALSRSRRFGWVRGTPGCTGPTQDEVS